jgi:hypothetical protein
VFAFFRYWIHPFKICGANPYRNNSSTTEQGVVRGFPQGCPPHLRCASVGDALDGQIYHRDLSQAGSGSSSRAYSGAERSFIAAKMKGTSNVGQYVKLFIVLVLPIARTHRDF